MPEITDYRITGLKTSIHSLRLRIGLLWSYLNKQNKVEFPVNDLAKKNNIKKEFTEYKSNFNKDTNHLNKKIKNNKLDEKKSTSKNDNGLMKVLPGECAINQGEEGDSAFLIISGSFNVEIDNKVIGGMSSGEIFGELSLILGEKRKATVRAITGSELVEIDSSFLKEYFISAKTSSEKESKSSLETQRVIKDLSTELSKKKDQQINITKEQLIEVVKEESPVIQSLAIQLHKRLSQMIMKEKKSQV
jgi:CRP-like cAMP-binding protein